MQSYSPEQVRGRAGRRHGHRPHGAIRDVSETLGDLPPRSEVAPARGQGCRLEQHGSCGSVECHRGVETPFCGVAFLCNGSEHLSRQARDKHTESLKTRGFLSESAQVWSPDTVTPCLYRWNLCKDPHNTNSSAPHCDRGADPCCPLSLVSHPSSLCLRPACLEPVLLKTTLKKLSRHETLRQNAQKNAGCFVQVAPGYVTGTPRGAAR